MKNYYEFKVQVKIPDDEESGTIVRQLEEYDIPHRSRICSDKHMQVSFLTQQGGYDRDQAWDSLNDNLEYMGFIVQSINCIRTLSYYESDLLY
jgi:hypothetical protein